MARPSRHVDRNLLAAGRDLYGEGGCAGLTVRRVAERAGVNPAMLHYHFGAREAFIGAVLQATYDEMFSALTLAVAPAEHPPEQRLRRALRVVARFVRDHRRLLGHLARDALQGEPVVVAFVRANLPRHFGVVSTLVAEGQAAGRLRPVPLAQALAFIAGALGAPILAGSALVASGLAPDALARAFEREVLSDMALDERIDLVLAGLAAP